MKIIQKETFDKFYHLHKNLVFNLALNYVQNVEDAEEITQDVFVSVFEKIDQFRADSALKTWIYRITINKSLDHIKSKKRQKRFGFMVPLFQKEEHSNKIPYFNHPGIELENREQLEMLFIAINKLPDSQKTVLILLKIEQNSQAETAVIMGMNEKAVESLFQRAKTNLKKYLNQNE